MPYAGQLGRVEYKPSEADNLALKPAMRDPLQNKSWRHHLRVSVRGLTVLVLVIGGLLGWAVRSARIQREVVLTIRRAGGGVTYGSQYLGGTLYDLSGKPWWCPRWLVSQIGIDYFDSPVQVVFANDSSRCTDAIVFQIAKLNRVEWLALDSSKITDVGLGYIHNMTTLTRLSLASTAVSDAGLAQLRKLDRLEALGLADTGIGDAGLAHLEVLTDLKSLRLEKTKLTDAGLRSLRSLPNLANLELDKTAVTDSAAREFQKALPNLKIISLR